MFDKFLSHSELQQNTHNLNELDFISICVCFRLFSSFLPDRGHNMVTNQRGVNTISPLGQFLDNALDAVIFVIEKPRLLVGYEIRMC